jgi:hypothetical protein
LRLDLCWPQMVWVALSNRAKITDMP